MEHELLDAAAGGDLDQVTLQQPQQFLRRCPVHSGVGGLHLTNGERALLSVIPEDHPPAAVSVLQGGHAFPLRFGLGNNLVTTLVSMVATPIRRILRGKRWKIRKVNGLRRDRNVEEMPSNGWTPRLSIRGLRVRLPPPLVSKS